MPIQGVGGVALGGETGAAQSVDVEVALKECGGGIGGFAGVVDGGCSDAYLGGGGAAADAVVAGCPVLF